MTDAEIDQKLDDAIGNIESATYEKNVTLDELERKIKRAGERAIEAIEERRR